MTALKQFKATLKQTTANVLMAGVARHVMLFGGSRSGKTFIAIRHIIMRAIKAPGSRHIVLRHAFNHVKASVVLDTLPKVLAICFPGLSDKCKLDKTDWYLKFSNGSEIWFGGLDDKERTEKILGLEFATIYLNECSQISWNSRNMAMTRLAQKTSLRLLALYDCNPPTQSHWSYRQFVQKINPETKAPIKNPDNYQCLQMNPEDNSENLPDSYIEDLMDLPERMQQRFLRGEFGAANDNALWTIETIEKCRIIDGVVPHFQRIVIAVDPSGCSGDEDKRSDEIGIVVEGLGVDGHAYLLEDLSGKFKPETWGNVVAQAFDRHGADCVVGEVNYGGDMVRMVIQAARPGTPFRKVTASRGKHVRAEPVSYLYPDKIHHVGNFPLLEDQLCDFSTAGYLGDKSPDRADAHIWAITELFPAIAKKTKTVTVSIPQTVNPMARM